MGTPQEPERAGRRTQRLRAVLPWVALFAAALLVRSLRFGLVFVNGEVRFPYGADELYHMRRIWFTVVNFPASLDFDLYMNHPEGAGTIWPPFFDWGIAALARVLVGPSDPHAVEVVAAWMPPLIGALAVVAAAWLARRTFSPASGWATGALLAPLPAHVWHGSLGMVDHHVAVGLFTTLLLAAAMRLAGPLDPTGRPRGAVSAGVAVAAAILLWPGALLHVLVVQAFLVVQLLASAEPTAARSRARALAVMHGVAAALLLPFCVGRVSPDFGPLSPLLLSRFQPLWFGAGALALALTGLLWAPQALGGERRRRVGSACALGAVGLAAAWLAVPGLSAALQNAAGWFEPDPFLGVIPELQPLLSPEGRFVPAYGHLNFSYLFWAYPLALGGLAWHAAAQRRGDVLLLLAAVSAFLAATLYQQRFADVSAAGFALVMAPALVEGLRAASRRFGLPRAVCAGLATLAVLAALLPSALISHGDVMASAAARRGERLGYGPEVRRRIVLERAAGWLRRETPPTQGYLDAARRPEYGVLGAWGQGHLLRYYAERPMVQDNFGPWGGRSGFELARRYFASGDEGQALEIAARLGARYVVATRQGSGQSPPRPDSIALRLVLVPAPRGGLALPGVTDRALYGHRLRFIADDSDLARGGEAPFRAAVYEIVPGARVVGRAPGAESAVFELEVPLPGRAPIRYRASAPVDGAGGYEIRLPYPSEEGYTVLAGERRGVLVLSEVDVREGWTVAGPSFAP